MRSKLITVFNDMKSGNIEVAAETLRALIEKEEHLRVLAAVSNYFLDGPLDWINHPERVVYSWERVNRRYVQATARYSGEEYRGVVRITQT